MGKTVFYYLNCCMIGAGFCTLLYIDRIKYSREFSWLNLHCFIILCSVEVEFYM